MKGAELFIDLPTIDACLRVALPMVNAEALSVNTQELHGLQEGAVGIPCVHPELHEGARPQSADEPKGKRDMP